MLVWLVNNYRLTLVIWNLSFISAEWIPIDCKKSQLFHVTNMDMRFLPRLWLLCWFQNSWIRKIKNSMYYIIRVALRSFQILLGIRNQIFVFRFIGSINNLNLKPLIKQLLYRKFHTKFKHPIPNLQLNEIYSCYVYIVHIWHINISADVEFPYIFW